MGLFKTITLSVLLFCSGIINAQSINKISVTADGAIRLSSVFVTVPVTIYELPFGVIDSSTIPMTPYDNLAMSLTPPQTMRHWHQYVFDWGSDIDTVDFRYKTYQENYSGTVHIVGQAHPSVTFRKNFGIYWTLGGYYLRVGDTLFGQIDTATAPMWRSHKLLIERETETEHRIKFYTNDVERWNHLTILPVIDTAIIPSVMLGWGTNTGTYVQTFGSFVNGTYQGLIDDIYLAVDSAGIDSTSFNTNFNWGYSQEPPDSVTYYVVDRGGYGIHGVINNGINNGMLFMSKDHYDGIPVVVEGWRKDTLKYASVGDSRDLFGVRYYAYYLNPAVYYRSVVNKVVTYELDRHIVFLTGTFNCFGDSSRQLSSNIAYYDSRTDSVYSMGGGLARNNDFGFWIAQDSNLVYVSHLVDSVYNDGVAEYTEGYLSVYNMNTGLWSGVGTGIDSIVYYPNMVKFDDLMYTFDGHRIKAWDGNEWIIKAVFPNYPSGIYATDDELIVMAGDSVMRSSDGETYELLALRGEGVSARNTIDYTIGMTYEPALDRLWITGTNDTIAGQLCPAYYQDGSFHSITETGTWGYRDFSTFITSVVRWQGAYVFAGFFRKINNISISSNMAVWDSKRGWGVLDYGSDWIIWGMSTFLDRYDTEALMVCGDFTSLGGAEMNHIGIRYSGETFRKLNPIVKYTSVTDKYVSQYPPSVSLTARSSRQYDITVDYSISNGDTKSAEVVQTDSVLSVSLGRVVKNFTATFGAGDIVSVGDTVEYVITTVDDLGNDTSFTDRFAIIAEPDTLNSHYQTAILPRLHVDTPDSLKSAYDWLCKLLEIADSSGVDTLGYGGGEVDGFYILATWDTTDSKLNLCGDTNNITTFNALTFTQYRGWTANTGSYLNTNFIPSTEGVSVLRDDNCVLWCVGTDVNTTTWDWGFQDGLSNAFWGASRYSGNFYMRNNSATTNTVGANATSINVYGNMRRASNLVVAFKGIDSVNAFTTASTFHATGNLYIGALNNNGTAGSSTTRQYRWFWVGKSRTTAQYQYIVRCIEWFMDYVGAGVLP